MILEEDFDLDVFLECETKHLNWKLEGVRKKYARRRKHNLNPARNNKFKRKVGGTDLEIENNISGLVDKNDIDSIIEEANRLRGIKIASGHSVKGVGTTPYVECPLCEKVFEKSLISDHMITNHSFLPKKVESKVNCHICDKVFANKNFLQRHIQSVHERVVKAKCDVCDKTFTDTSNYKQHLLIHSGVKSYICQICGKGFVQPQGLRMHMPSHSNDYPFSCNLCSKKFRRKQHFELHMVKHTGKKSHQCETCGKFFSVKNELKMHSWIHKEEWPYLCLQCNKGFNQSCGLRLHVKNHHALEA